MKIKEQLAELKKHLKLLGEIMDTIEIPTPILKEVEKAKQEDVSLMDDIDNTLSIWVHRQKKGFNIPKSLEKAALLALLHQLHNQNLSVEDIISRNFTEAACYEARRLLFNLPGEVNAFIKYNEKSQVTFTDLVMKERRRLRNRG